MKEHEATDRLVRTITAFVTLTLYLLIIGACFGLVGAVSRHVYNFLAN